MPVRSGTGDISASATVADAGCPMRRTAAPSDRRALALAIAPPAPVGYRVARAA